MKRIATLLIWLLAVTFSAISSPVDVKTAERAAKSFMMSKECDTIGFANLSEKLIFKNLFVFGNTNGFVIIANDDCVSPVLGYSTESSFDTNDIPACVLDWLKDYDDAITALKKVKSDTTSEIHADWDNLLNGKGLETKLRASVKPLIRTKWSQNEPFNNSCPPDTANHVNGHAVAGCGAVAMAQLMNYWEHPVRGVGFNSYQHPVYGTLSANFGETVYHWDNMKNVYSKGYTEAEAQAVATLVYHCGIAVNMDFGPTFSGVNSTIIDDALKNYFDYSSSTNYVQKASYSNSQWISILKNNLNAGRPIIYRGQSQGSNSGHIFVCDGYDESNHFHFNWGWAGKYDGYFAIGSITPPGHNFNSTNAAILNCYPNTPSINPPTNVATQVNGRDVSISWNAVSNAIFYKVYRDGDRIINVTGTDYHDDDVDFGSHSYYVKSVKSDGTMSLKSNTSTVNIHFSGPQPTDLQGTPNGHNVQLSWVSPTPKNSILSYGTGSYSNLQGYSGSGTYWAQRFPTSTLCEFAGMAIYKISAYFKYAGDYTLYLYKGDEAITSELICQRNYTATAESWQDISLPNPAVIDYTHDLWIVLFTNMSTPAPCCSYYGTGGADASLISSNGLTWTYISNKSWMIKTHITDGTYTYNLYRNNNVIANGLNGNSYTDSNLPDGYYNYHVTTNYYGGESDPSNQVTVQVYNPSYTINAMANPSNGGSISGSGTYEVGQTCTLTATSNTGHYFVNWTENGQTVSSNANYSFTVTGNRNLVANFMAESYTITTSSTPNNSGSTTGGGTYTYGQTCTLHAVPNTGYSFLKWTKNGAQVSTNPNYSFTITESASYVAQFIIQSYNVTVNANPTEGGTVSGGGSYTYGQNCTVHAIANTGFTFLNWTLNENPVSSNPDYSFTVTDNTALAANFRINTYTISAQTDPENAGTITGMGTYHHGETITLHIEPFDHYSFLNWTENGIIVSESETYSLTVTDSHELVAHLIFYDGLQEGSSPIEVYPNPSNDVLNIKGHNIRKVVIINLLGQIVDTIEALSDDIIQINVQGYKPALYNIMIQTNKDIVMRKFAKN